MAFAMTQCRQMPVSGHAPASSEFLISFLIKLLAIHHVRHKTCVVSRCESLQVQRSRRQSPGCEYAQKIQCRPGRTQEINDGPKSCKAVDGHRTASAWVHTQNPQQPTVQGIVFT